MFRITIVEIPGGPTGSELVEIERLVQTVDQLDLQRVFEAINAGPKPKRKHRPTASKETA